MQLPAPLGVASAMNWRVCSIHLLVVKPLLPPDPLVALPLELADPPVVPALPAGS